METALGKSKELYDKDWSNYSKAVGYKISEDERWIDKFSETTYAQLTGYTTLEEARETFSNAVSTMATKISGAYSTMQTRIDGTLKAMGTSTQEFATNLESIMASNSEKLGGYTEDAEEDIKAMGDAAKDAMKEAAENWKKYAEYVATSAGANESLATAINNVITAIGNVTAPLDTLKEKYQEVER
jgi:hypothetical protein